MSYCGLIRIKITLFQKHASIGVVGGNIKQLLVYGTVSVQTLVKYSFLYLNFTSIANSEIERMLHM